MSFDLLAAVEDDGKEPFFFHIGDDWYELPPHADVRAVAAMSAGHLDDAFRLLLGVEQWERLRADPRPFDDRHLKALMDAYGEHVGLTVGESLASTTSLSNTETQ